MFIIAALELSLSDSKWQGGRSQSHSCHARLRWIICLAELHCVIADWLQPPCVTIGACSEKGINPAIMTSFPLITTLHSSYLFCPSCHTTLDYSSSFNPESQSVCVGKSHEQHSRVTPTGKCVQHLAVIPPSVNRSESVIAPCKTLLVLFYTLSIQAVTCSLFLHVLLS